MDYFISAGVILGLIVLGFKVENRIMAKVDKKVEESTCNQAQQSIKELFEAKIDPVKKDTDELKCDVKKLLKKNGIND